MWFRTSHAACRFGLLHLSKSALTLTLPLLFGSYAFAAAPEVRCGGQPAVWKMKSRGVTAKAQTLRAASSRKAYAISKQRITKGDGCVSFAAPEARLERVVGMATNRNVTALSSFFAAVHLQSGGKFSLILQGQETDEQWAYRRGDRFIIGSDQGNVQFWKNGKLVATKQISAASPMTLAALLKKAGASVGGARIASGACRRWLRNGNCRNANPLPAITPISRENPREDPRPTVKAGPTGTKQPDATRTPSSSSPAPGNTPPPSATSTPENTPAPAPTNTPTATPSPISGTVYYVSPSGSDSNSGTSVDRAWKTVKHAASSASSNSTVLIRAGTYTEALTLNRSNITFQGYPGDAKPVITYGTGGDTSTILIGTNASNLKLKDLNISGGYYAIKFDSSWSNGGGGTGPHHITIEGCLLHDSASHIVKIQPKANYITFQDCELHHSGRRSGLEGQGIDAVNVGNFTFQNNYIHDTTHVCLFTKGGAQNSLVQNNVMQNCGWNGILLGQDTGRNFMDSATNPNLYECINCTARNNIVLNTGYAGIGSYSSSGTKIYNNTVINAASLGQAGIFLSTATVGHSGPAGVNYDIRGNIITVNPAHKQALAIANNAYSGTPTLNNNVYFTSSGNVSFVDNRSGDTRNFEAWRSATGQDANSIEANPSLVAPQLNGTNVYPGPGSPALNLAPDMAGTGFNDDYFRTARPSGNWDAGAVQHK